MIPVPPANVVEGIEDGTATITRRCEFYEYDGVTPWSPDGPSITRSFPRMGADATVTMDSNREERRMFESTFDNRDGKMSLNPFGGFWYDKIIKPFKGVRLQDGTEWEMQVGEFGVDKIDDQNFPNQVKVSARDGSARMMGSKITEGLTFPASTKIGDIIRSLAANAGINKMRIPADTPTLGVEYQAERGTSRWTIATSCATSKSYDVYFDHEGYIVLATMADPAYDAVQAVFQTGPNGNLSNFSRSATSTEVYNHIVVIGERETEEGLPYFGEAINNDPASPTSVQNIGHRMMDPVVLSTLASNAECVKLAQSMLKVAGLESYTMSGNSISYPWIDAGITTIVRDPKALATDPKRYLLETVTLRLGPGPMDWTAKRITIISSTVQPDTVDPITRPPVTNPDLPPGTGNPVNPGQPDTGTEPEPNPNGTAVNFGLASYNMGGPKSGSDEQKIASINKLIEEGADVVCLQEVRSNVGALNKFVQRNSGWDFWAGDNDSSRTVGILYRKALGTVFRREQHLAVPSRVVGPKGPGPTKMPAKYVMEVGIMVNGRKIEILNTHMLAGAQRSKRDLGAREWTLRRDHYRDHIKKLTDITDARLGLVFSTGDFNATTNFDLLNPYTARFNIDHNYITRDSRRIDFVSHRNHNAVTVVDMKIITVNSDHKAPLIKYQIKAA